MSAFPSVGCFDLKSLVHVTQYLRGAFVMGVVDACQALSERCMRAALLDMVMNFAIINTPSASCWSCQLTQP